jgi:hypothetical protein
VPRPLIGLAVEIGHEGREGRHVGLRYSHSSAQTRKQWIAALDIIETLKPRAVIAGHKKAEKDDNPKIIEETRQECSTVVEIFREKGNT